MGRLPDVFKVTSGQAASSAAAPSEVGRTRRERVRWGRVVLVALSGVVSHVFGRATVGVLVPAMADDLDLSDTLIGALGSMTMFYGPASVIGPAASGWLADRTGSFSATYGVIAALALTACICMATMRRRDGVAPQPAPLS